MTFFIKNFFSKCDQIIFTEEILNEKLHFLCNAFFEINVQNYSVPLLHWCLYNFNTSKSNKNNLLFGLVFNKQTIEQVITKPVLSSNSKSIRPDVFCKKGACNFIKKETLVQVFSCEFCEISKKTFFYRTPLVAASEILQTKENKSYYNILPKMKFSLI